MVPPMAVKRLLAMIGYYHDDQMSTEVEVSRSLGDKQSSPTLLIAIDYVFLERRNECVCGRW